LSVSFENPSCNGHRCDGTAKNNENKKNQPLQPESGVLAPKGKKKERKSQCIGNPGKMQLHKVIPEKKHSQGPEEHETNSCKGKDPKANREYHPFFS